uniref:Uncharacterized protein n=1 Tax=uncultured prokaryote TaxID=198431 RepID=A0A0H5Q3A9_9ZZZZ|nr:hypothetical protein [uncultured prokaryote]
MLFDWEAFALGLITAELLGGIIWVVVGPRFFVYWLRRSAPDMIEELSEDKEFIERMRAAIGKLFPAASGLMGAKPNLKSVIAIGAQMAMQRFFGGMKPPGGLVP